MCRSYYRGSDAIVFVYDATNRESLNNINFWTNELAAACQLDGMPWNTCFTQTTQCALVGNKADLVEDRRSAQEEGMMMADRLRIDHFLTSALDGENIDAMFASLAQALWINWETGQGRVKRLHASRVSQVMMMM